MAILIISTNTEGRHTSINKRPGLQFVNALRDASIFSLVDVPGYLYLSGLSGSLKILRFYTNGIIKLLRSKERDIFFYNFPLAYLPIYLILIISRLHRPSLVLADGINCVGLRRSHYLFFKLFNRIIFLPINNDIKPYLNDGCKYIWYPGIVINKKRRNKNSRTDNIRLLYNSNLLAHNSPELLLEFARNNSSLTICITEYEESYKNFLHINNIECSNIPVNINFLGIIPYDDYILLFDEIDGILLIRDENIYWNKYNFPSKLIEALQNNIPMLSLFDIINIPSNLYLLIEGKGNVEQCILNYINKWNAGSFESEKNEFLYICDSKRLLKWLNG